MLKFTSVNLSQLKIRTQKYSEMSEFNSEIFSKESPGGVFNKSFFKADERESRHEQDTVMLSPTTSFTARTLEEKYGFKKVQSDNLLKSTTNYVKKYYTPSGDCLRDYFYARFPIFYWIFRYDLKGNAMKDIVSGVTVSLKNLFAL